MLTRTQAVESAMDDIRTIEADLGVTRAGVEAMRDRLIELATHGDLFSLADFPAPEAHIEATNYLYRLAQDDDDRFTLYAQSSNGQVETPPHNHTTWAVVVGISGSEHNRFYERTAEGVAVTHEHTVEAGTGIAMLPDDLHSIHIDGAALNFHCYGLALERLDEREYYSNGEWKIFTNHTDVREARTNLQSC